MEMRNKHRAGFQCQDFYDWLWCGGYVDKGPVAAFAPATHLLHVVYRPTAASEQEASILRPSNRTDAALGTASIGLEKLGQIRTRQDQHFGNVEVANRDASAGW